MSCDLSTNDYDKIAFKYSMSFLKFVPCINSIKTLFYYSKLKHTIIKS